jgi:adenylate cyclase
MLPNRHLSGKVTAMATEIERKFLVSGEGWRNSAESSRRIQQGYLALEGDVSLRIRIIDDNRARLTVKSGAGSMSRDEFEYPVPLEDARDMMRACRGRIVEKTRFAVPYRGFIWEIDVYDGALSGLTVAEVELSAETDEPAIPGWIGEEVTGDGRWSNAALAANGLPRGRHAQGAYA